MENFNSLKFKGNANLQAIMFFSNGYGVSIIMNSFSYGGKEGLYELAVIKGNAENWKIVYDTGITEDVIGYLSPEDINHYMQLVQQLGE